VRSHFRPEFINRVDEFIVFEPLVQQQIRAIVGQHAAALVARVAQQRINLQLDDSALDYLASKGFDQVYGARPVKRALQRELQTHLAQSLLRAEFVEGDTILVQAAADGEGLLLSKAAAAEEEGPVGNGAPKAAPARANSSSSTSSVPAGEGEGTAQAPPAPAAKRSMHKIVVRGVRKGASSKESPVGNGAPAAEGVNGVNGTANGHADV
jgi:ATP-dependent Clp protease ATP-binding subunit ClpB